MAALFLGSASAKDTKVGIISDIHLKLKYDPSTSSNNCGSAMDDPDVIAAL